MIFEGRCELSAMPWYMQPATRPLIFTTLWLHCDDFEVGGYAHAQSMTTCIGILYDAHQRT